MTPQQIVRLVETRRFPLSDEKRLQECLAAELEKIGAIVVREVRLSKKDVIDMMIGEVGIEVKIKGQRRAIFRQCERYCRHEAVKALVLVTNAAMGMPAEISGKPIFVASLGKAWL